jgi:hypothetical protein
MPSSEGSGSTSHLQQENGSGSTSIQGEATLILCSGETTSAGITRCVVLGISLMGVLPALNTFSLPGRDG